MLPPVAEAADVEPVLIRSPQKLAEGWRLEWTSLPGRTYRIDRSANLVSWTEDIGRVTATGPLSVFVDTNTSAFTSRFWRVVLLPGGDTSGPIVSPVTTRIVETVGGRALEMRAQATDANGVVGLVFLEGGATSLGSAVFDLGTQEWKLERSLPADPLSVLLLQARAQDPSGNLGDSPLRRFTLFDPARFAALDGSGKPLRGVPVVVDDADVLAPFEFRIGGGGHLGSSGDLIVRFPAGARLIRNPGQPRLEFSQAELLFGEDSPFSLRPVPGPGGLPRSLPLSFVSVADLESAFGLAVGSGIPIRLFDLFDLRLVAGTFLPEGILASVLRMDDPRLAGLPFQTASFAEHLLTFEEPGQILLPIFGVIELRPGIPGQPLLQVSPQAPLWLGLNDSGAIQLEGAADILIPESGLRARVRVRLDDPDYQLLVEADGFTFPMADGLADLLPPVPASVNTQALDAETERVRSLARAFHALGATAATTGPLDPGAQAPAAPPDTAVTLGQLLDGWTASAALGVVGSLSGQQLDALRGYARQMARTGSGSLSNRVTTEQIAVLMRARARSEFDALEPDFTAAIDQLNAAALLRAGAAGSTEEVLQALRYLLEALALAQASGAAEVAAVRSEAESLVDRFLEDLVRVAQVEPGVFSAPAGSPIANLNRFVAAGRLRELVDLLTARQLLGALDATPAVEAYLTQLAVRMAGVAGAAFGAAEAASDYRAALYALEDLADLVALRQLGLFPVEAEPVLDAAGITATVPTGLINRLGAVLASDQAKPVEERSWFDLSAEVSRLLSILEPADAAGMAAFASNGALVRARTRLGTALATAASATALAGEQRVALLVDMIKAGNLKGRLARRATPGFSDTEWEVDQLPRIVGRLVAVAAQKVDWSGIDAAVAELVSSAEHVKLEAASPGADVSSLATSRARLLNQALVLLGVHRNLVSSAWESAASARAAAGLATLDLLLPGDMTLVRPWGEIRFNRETGKFVGALGGGLRMPGLVGGTELEVLGLSLSNRGEFDLAAYGQIQGLPLGSLTGTLEVPMRRPLRISWREGRGAEVAGAVTLRTSNGFFFEGYIDFADPLYRFGLAAGGLRADLARDAVVSLPPRINFDGAVPEVIQAWSDYFSQVGAAVEPLADLAATPLLGQPARRPEFRAPAIELAYADVGAWVRALAIDSDMAAAASIQRFLGMTREHLVNARRMLTEASAGLELQRRLAALEELNRHLRSLIEIEGVSGAAAADPEITAYVDELVRQARQLLADPLMRADQEIARKVVQTALEIEALRAMLGRLDPLDEAPDFASVLQAADGNFLEELGLSPVTGSVVQPALFEGLGRVALVDAYRRLTDVQATLQLQGAESLDERFNRASLEIIRRLRSVTRAEFERLPSDDWQRREELIQDLALLAREAVIGPGSTDPVLQQALRDDLQTIEATLPALMAARQADQRTRLTDPLYSIWARVRDALRNLNTEPATLSEASRTYLEREMTPRREFLAGVLTTAIGQPIPDFGEPLSDLIDLVYSAEETLGRESPEFLAARTVLVRTSIEIPAAAEAQEAWWEILEYVRLVNEGLSRRPNQLQTAAGQAFLDSSRAASNLAGRLLAALTPRIEAERPLDLSLPGDLVVRRVSGDFMFRRAQPGLPAAFSGTFAGRFEFPEVDASFDILAASVSSDGAWRVRLAASAPIEAGGDALRFELTDFDLQGSASGTIGSASGSALLRVRRTDAPAEPDSVYSAAVSYQPHATGRILTIATQSQARMVFDRDLVVFETNLELGFTRDARSGRLLFGGTAGFFRRGSIPDNQVGPEDFELALEEAALAISYFPGGFSLEVVGGRLVLPVFEEVIGTIACDGDAPLAERPVVRQPPSVSLGTGLLVTVLASTPGEPTRLTFGTVGGQPVDLAFANIGLTLPFLPELRLDICSARLELPSLPGELPVLRDLDARLELPLPDQGGQRRVVRTVVRGKDWRADGLPELLQVGLDSDLRVVDLPDLKLDFARTVCSGDSLVLSLAEEVPALSGGTTRRLSLAGGVRLTTNAVRLENSGAPATLETCGSLNLFFDFDAAGALAAVRPLVDVDQVSFTGRFRLGGPQGVVVTGPGGVSDAATVTVINPLGFFDPSPVLPGELQVGARVAFGDFAAFVMEDVRFIFDSLGAPRFSGRLALDAGNQLQLLQMEQLPIVVRSAGLTVTDSLPLDQMFLLQNLLVDISGHANFRLPLEQADETVDAAEGDENKLPRLFFDLDRLQFGFPNGLPTLAADGRLLNPPSISVNSLTGSIQNLNLGEFAGITGGLSISGLNGPVDAIVIAGEAGALVQGVGVRVLIAAKLEGLVAVCIKADLGPAGIPLDGGALGGVLLTGATGGVSFSSSGGADPCAPLAQIGVTSDGRLEEAAPGSALEQARILQKSEMAWSEVMVRSAATDAGRRTDFEAIPVVLSPAAEPVSLAGPSAETPQAEGEGCPTGDCPPETLNLLCQRHPSFAQTPSPANYAGEFASTIIVKGTSLTQAQVDDLITRAGLDGILGAAGAGSSLTNAEVADRFAVEVRNTVSTLIPRPPAGSPGEADLLLAIEDALDLLRDILRATTRRTLDGLTAGLTPRDALRKAGYAGLECRDVTTKLSGTFSHTAVSTFLKVEGGYSVSTRGFGEVSGALTLTGIPVGTADLALALSDSEGNLAPLLCGTISAAIGPVEFGGLRLRFDPGINTNAVLASVADFLSGLGASASAVLYDWVDNANGPVVADRTVPLVQFFQATYPGGTPATRRLTQAQQHAVLAQLFNLQNLTAIDGAPAGALQELEEAALDLIIDITLALNPDLRFCGSIEPKIFGFPVSGGEVAGVELFYSRLPGAPGTPSMDVLSGSFSASPSFLIFNYGIMLSTAGLVSPFIPGVDSASVGFSTRARSFDREMLRAVFSGPAGAAAQASQRFGEVLQNSLVTMDYTLRPFGLELANGQARFFMPNFAGHPTRQGVNWLPPSDPAFPATAGESSAARLRREVILRAAAANRIGDQTWIGAPEAPSADGRLGALFPENTDLATRMDGLSLGRDLFPYGGVLGAGRLALPRIVSDAPPAVLGEVLDPSLDLADRLTALQEFLTFLGETRPVGDLAFYFPAPNPPQVLLNAELNANGFKALVDGMQSLDYTAITRGVRDNGFYAFDQAFMRGGLDLPILGVPLAAGTLQLDGATGLLKIEAGTPEGSWTRRLAGADARLLFSVREPRAAERRRAELLAATPPGQPLLPSRSEASIESIPELVAAFSAPGANVDLFRQRLFDALPRVELTADVSVNLANEGLGDFIRPGSGAALKLFAFSPGFDPDAPVPGGGDPLNPDPYTLARRMGGAGFKGSLQFGHFPSGLVIDVEEAALAFFGPSGTNLLPGLSGRLDVPELTLPSGLRLEGFAQFNSQPLPGGDFLRIEGSLSPFTIRAPNPLGGTVDLLRFQADASGGALSGNVRVTRTGQDPIAASVALRISAARAEFPMFGPDVAVTAYGCGGTPGQLEPFTFSTQPGEAWCATATLHGSGGLATPPSFSLRDPFSAAGAPIAVFTPSAPITASLAGTGAQSFRLSASFPGGFSITLYPGTENESTVTVPSERPVQLLADSEGRMLVSLGSLTGVQLPGLLSADAIVEFGYNPSDPSAIVTSSRTSVDFGPVNLVGSSNQSVRLSNLGTLSADILLELVQPPGVSDYKLNTRALQIEPGGFRDVTLSFRPTASGVRNGTLRIRSNDTVNPTRIVPLTGIGVQAARFSTPTTSIRFFDTVVGGKAEYPLTVTNTGSADLSLGVPVMTGPFAVSPSSGTIVAPGATITYLVRFEPTALGSSAGTIVLPVPAPIGNQSISLSGTGVQSRWVKVLDPELTGSALSLNDIRMLDEMRGIAVGSSGAFFETQDGGRSWRPRVLTNRTLNSIASETTQINNAVLARYSFEEPPGSMLHLDSSGNRRDGRSVVAPATATQTHLAGRFGAGLRLSGSQYAELGTFSLPSSFTLAASVKFSTSADGQTILGKHSSLGIDQFVLAKAGGGWRITSGANSFVIPAIPPTNTWLTIVLTGSYNSITNETAFSLYQGLEGSATLPIVGSGTLTGAVSTASGRRWSLGQDWDVSLTSDFLRADVDEVWFFDGILSSTERLGLHLRNGEQVVVAGLGGVVLQTYNSGRNWAQHPDVNALGWRTGSLSFITTNWRSALLNAGKIVLGGQQGASARLLMVEDGQVGEDGIAETADDTFGIPSITGAPNAAFPAVTGLALVGDTIRASESGGSILTQTLSSGATSSFAASTSTVGPSLNAIAGFGVLSQFVAVGSSGTILRANGGNAASVTSTTSETLRDVVFDGSVSPSFHAVGDNSAYVVSSDNGATWTTGDGGLAGSIRSIDVEHQSGAAATQYHGYAGMADGSVHYRAPVAVAGPFFNAYPSVLDFGFTPTGSVRSRQVQISNRGATALSLTSVSIDGPSAGSFFLGSGTVARIEPGDTIAITVDYSPITDQELDAADLVITTNEAGAVRRIGLRGRSSGNEWRPVPIATGGIGVAGEVAGLVFTSGTRGYALVNPTSGASIVYRTNDGGLSWTSSTLPAAAGNRARMAAISAVRIEGTSSDIILVAGQEQTSAGALVRGVLYRAITSSSTFASLSWVEQTPGGATQALSFADVDASPPLIGATNTNLRIVAATTGSATTANVWESSNSGATWTQPSGRPSDFSGGPVDIEPGPTVPVWAASSTRVEAKTFQQAWASPTRQIGASSTIRDLSMRFSGAIGADLDFGFLVGDSGLFLRWQPTGATPSTWAPPKDAEVFGTTNLRAAAAGGFGERAFIVGDSKIFSSLDTGMTWSLDLDAGQLAQMRSVSTLSRDVAWVGGSLNGIATVWRYVPPAVSSTGRGSIPDFVDLGDIAVLGASGSRPSVAVRLNNPSASSPLSLGGLRIASEDRNSRFSLAGTLPAGVSAGSFVDINFQFDNAASLGLGDLNPVFFHRFDGTDELGSFRDDSPNAHRTDGGVPAGRRPREVLTSLRSLAVQFDGIDDRVQLAPAAALDSLPASFTLALLTLPENTASSRVLVSKDLANGSDGVKILQTSAGYEVRILGAVGSFPVAHRNGWRHLAFVFNASGGSTHVSLLVDGQFIQTRTLAATAGSVAGLPWLIGAEWTGASTTGGSYLGMIDDVALFARALTDAEINRLAQDYSLPGEHRASLFVPISGGGVREVRLRARVVPEPRIMVLDTIPAGLPLLIDGVARTAPVSFTITPFASGASGALEWTPGSAHRIAPVNLDVSLAGPGGSSTAYRFSRWSHGVSQPEFILVADGAASSRLVAEFQPFRFQTPAVVAPPPPRTAGPDPLISGLANTPKGPFLRVREGSLKLPNLGANGFSVVGELFVSPTRVRAVLQSSELAFPATGTPHMTLGATEWRLEADLGGDLLIRAESGGATLFGADVAPDGMVELRYTRTLANAAPLWSASFLLREDFRPLPDLLEFPKGRVQVEWLPSGLPGLALTLKGGIRILKLPDGSGNFAFARTVDLRFDTIHFDISLNDALALAGISIPARLVDTEVFDLDWGDVRLRRIGGGPVSLSLSGMGFRVNGRLAVAVSGSVDSRGRLLLEGSLPTGGRIDLVPGGHFFLERTGGTGDFQFEFDASRPGFPAMRLNLPSLALKSTASTARGAALPGAGLILPGLSLDTSGAFDTGKIELPSFSLDGIALAANPSGELDDNHLRVRRDGTGTVSLEVKAEQQFITCRQDVAFELRSSGGLPSISGSVRGNFCVLPEPITLRYDSSSSCQFSGSAFGFTVQWGSSCARVLAGGVCVLGCP